MDEQKPLEDRVRQYYVCPGCGNMTDYSQLEQHRKEYSGNIMGMDLMDFFRQNSDIYDEANLRSRQQVRKVLTHMYVGDFRKAPEGIRTVGDLFKYNDAELGNDAYKACVGFGAKTLGVINATLNKAGLPSIAKSNRPYYNRTLYPKSGSVSANAPSLK